MLKKGLLYFLLMCDDFMEFGILFCWLVDYDINVDVLCSVVEIIFRFNMLFFFE